MVKLLLISTGQMLAFTHPLAGLQESVVQAFLSSQLIAA
jgi:hypothetical protein